MLNNGAGLIVRHGIATAGLLPPRDDNAATLAAQIFYVAAQAA